jgi:3-hydroxy acid dehydrogenase / malonic semialdehyde reductase
MPSTRDKLILVTGASAGIGEACARRFAAEGARLVLWARREDRLAALADELGQRHGTDVRTATIDVRDRAGVFAAAGDLIRAAGAPDVLLNNAGLAAGLARIHEGDPDDWDRMLDTNVRGLLNVTRAFLPAMVERGSGHVVNIGSTAGHQVYPMGNVYNATKFAVRALNEGMSVDLLGTPIRVSSVDPGFVETEFARVRFHGDEERADGVYRGFRPLAADDVADAVAYVVHAPEHVNVFNLVLMPTAQRSSYLVHRQE